MRTQCASFGLIALLLASGCGGGGGTVATSSTGADQSSAFGPFQTRAQSGTPHVTSSSLANSTVTGVAGASFSTINYQPGPALANSRLAYLRVNNGPSTLNIADSNGTASNPIAGCYPRFRATWSRDGRLAFDTYNYVTNLNDIWVVNSDGTNLHRISSGGFNDANPSWSPDNYHIAFTRYGSRSQIYLMTSSGGSVTLLSDGTTNDDEASWTPDGSQVVFAKQSVTTGQYDIWRVNVGGGAPTQVTTFGASQNAAPAVAPNGTRIVVSVPGTTLTMYLATYPAGTPIAVLRTGSGLNDYVRGWSADGTKILFEEDTSTFSSDCTITAEGQNFTTLESFGNSSAGNCTFEPNPIAIPYVSSTGGYTVSNASSGFLFGMNGSALTSFVNFTATTPSSTTLTVDPLTNGSSNFIYHVHADALTSLRYVNGFGGGVNTVSMGHGAQQALVSFDASVGTVSAVLTLAAKSAPSIVASKSGFVCTGAFSGAWDKAGHNLAPSGAAQVTLSRRGEVVSAR